MDNFIFRSPVQNIESKFFCLRGHEDFLDDEGYSRLASSDSHNVCAKIVTNKKSKNINDSNHNSYYIKIHSDTKIYNPIEQYSSVKDKNSYNFVNSTCKNQLIFKEVNQQIFEKYLRFLNTKNIAWLKEAERDLK